MLSGKGFYIWRIRDTLNGNVEAIADKLEATGMTHAWIKVADGSWRYNIDPLGVDRVPGLVNALRMRGIAVWGWQYVYGSYPLAEADTAIQRIRELDLDGFVVNAEVQYKTAGASAATAYMQRLRGAFPDLPIGLSSYRFPSYHPEFPFDAFLTYCDFNAPQVYWVWANNAGDQLRATIKEFQKLVKVQRPIFPTGAAYAENGWKPTAGQVQDLMETAKSLGLCGFNFWEMNNCLINLPDIWDKIADFPFSPSAQPTPPVEEVVHSAGLIGTVLTKQLNVRNGPGIGFADVGDKFQGDLVPILDVAGSDAWAKISEDPERWVALQYLGVRYLGVSHADTEQA